MNKTLEVLYNRTSLRRYKDCSIDPIHVEQIKKAIKQAPTAGNMMLYSVISVTNDDKKKKLSKTCDDQDFIATAPLVMIFLADMNKIYNYFDACRVKEYASERNKEYKHGGMASLFLSCSDALIASQNAVIAGESLGIGSCYIGDIMENYEEHREILNLPDNVFPIGMLTFGYYPKDFNRVYRPRFEDQYVFFDEEYNNLTEEEYSDMYKNKEETLVNKELHNVDNFGQLLYKRKFGNEFFEEMNRSVSEILEHWK